MAPIAIPVSQVFGSRLAGCCQVGADCNGPCITTPLGNICIGQCVPRNGGGGVGPGDPVCPTTGTVLPVNCCPSFGGQLSNPGCPQFVGPPLPPPVGPPPPPPPQNGTGRGGCPPRGLQAQKILCPPGCHANKSDYFLKGGTFVAEGTRCVTNRRRNPLNPRALDRASGRLRSAKKAGAFLAKLNIPKRRR